MLKNKLLSLLSMAGIGAMSPAFSGMQITASAKDSPRKRDPYQYRDGSYGAARYYSGAKLARKAAAGKIGKAVLR